VNIRDLLDVRVICETGSLRKAAVVLGVTQPTLSNRVAHLEQQLGARLFERGHGKSQPTALALLIASRAGKLAGETQSLLKDAQQLAAGKSGAVKIGVGGIVLRILMADNVSPLDVVHHDLSLQIIMAHTEQLEESLLRRDLDLIVSAPTRPQQEGIRSELLLDAAVVVVAHPEHPLCERPPADFRGLFEYPLAMSVLEEPYRDELLRHGIDYDKLMPGLVSSDLGLILGAVARRPRLFTAGPRVLYAPELAAGLLRIVEVEVPLRHRIYLHENRDTHPLPAVARVKDTIRAIFARLPNVEAPVAAASAGDRVGPGTA
jgi:DNA-binding transcriptional LysR family regulator